MDKFYRRALKNIVRNGDTDIFPFPVDNHIFHDKLDDIVDELRRLDLDVKASLAQTYPRMSGRWHQSGIPDSGGLLR